MDSDYSKLNYTKHSKPTDDLSPGAKIISFLSM